MKFSWIALLMTVLVTLVLAAGILVRKHGLLSPIDSAAFWQSFTSPGLLSLEHAQLEKDCGACHSPGAGATDFNCLVCHADMERLLNREATAFHANIENCIACHREHKGPMVHISAMDHNRYAELARVRSEAGTGPQKAGPLSSLWQSIANIQQAEAPETALNCIACHSEEDPHYGYLGDACIACHNTRTWSLPEYIHPGESSQDCDQCHKAPPNHWMSMFKGMMPDEGQRKGRIGDCYVCHTTKSWDDIKGMPMHRAMHEPKRED